MNNTGTKTQPYSVDAPQPAIEMRDITVRFGEFTALDKLNLTVDDGELLTVLGPSGSGKSTLLNIVAGSLYPTSGSIHFENKNVTDLPPHKRRVGMVFQKYTLFPNKTIAENIAFPLAIRKIDKAELNSRVTEAIEMVGLKELADRYPSQISGGQAQRAAVARAVVFNPAILLMDEPLGALDRALRKSLQFEIRSLQRRLAVPTLYVTHDQEEAMSLSDRIVILRDGLIAAQGSPRDLYENPNSMWTATFLGDANCFPVEGGLEINGAETHVRVLGGKSVPARGLAGKTLPEDAVIVVRPENCIISSNPDTDSTFCEATVKWVEYLGTIQRIRLTMDSHEATVDLPGRETGIEAGEFVYVGWKAEHALVVPRV